MFNFYLLKGEHFSTKQCENEAYINGISCKVVSSSSTEITCSIGKKSGLIQNKFYPIEVLVKNKGYALQKDYFRVNFLPSFLTIFPKTGKIVVQPFDFNKKKCLIKTLNC